MKSEKCDSRGVLEQILKFQHKGLGQNNISNKLNQYYNELPILSYKEVAEKAFIKEKNIYPMTFPINVDEVVAAIITADSIGKNYKNR